MEREDKKIICEDCKKEFIFTAGEQEFFAMKGFSEPIRCKACRDKRKAEKEKSNDKSKRQIKNY